MVYKWISSTMEMNSTRRVTFKSKRLRQACINFIRGIKKFVTTWRVTDSFHKAACFDTCVNFRSFANLGYTEKSDKSAINQLHGTNSEETLKSDVLNEILKKNLNLIIISHLNINSIRNKFEMLKAFLSSKFSYFLFGCFTIMN